MKTIAILAKRADGTKASLYLKTDAEWLALDVRDIEKMKNFHPDEVFEINIGEDDTVNYLRQGCKIDFAYILK